MRFTLALALAIAVTGPTYSQIDADFAQANRIFGQVSPTTIVEGIDGEWLPLSTISNLKGAEPDPGLISSYLERLCGGDPVRGVVFRAVDKASFEMTHNNAGGPVSYRFDWIGGAQFHRSFDPAALFSAFKYDTMEDDKGLEMRSRTLESMTSAVDFYRISPDLIAMATPKRVEIYGRCSE